MTYANADDGYTAVPHSIEAEQSVLGGLLIAPDKLDAIRATLDPSDFYRSEHRDIYRAILALHDAGQPFDAVTLGEHLGDTLREPGYLIELANTTPSAANIDAYAGIVAERASQRRIIEAASNIIEQARNPNGLPVEDVYLRSLSTLASLGDRLTLGGTPPVDLFSAAAPPMIRREWLPPALSDFVFEMSEVKGSPPEVLALSALVACSAACHDAFRVQPRPNEPGWTESARLWGMIVGDPSAMKSPPMRLAASPLIELNMKMVDQNKATMADYMREMDTHKLREKQRAKAIANGDGLPDDITAPDRPKQHRLVINDATIEKLSDLMCDNPRGMLYINDELAGWFASMDIYSKGGTSGRDRSYWLRFYDGGPLVVDRMSRETTVVENASMRVLGAIQPERIRALASKMDDDGLLQRFIVAIIPTAQRFPGDKPEPAHLKHAYRDIVQQIYSTVPGDAGNCIVGMDPEAFVIQNDLMADIRAMVGTEGLPPMLRSHLAKWPGLFPRLCLTYHMIACAAARKFPTSFPIAASTARRVADLMRGWMLPSAISFYTGLVGHANPGYELAKQIANLILARELKRLTMRDLTQSLNQWRSAPEWRQRAAIAQLEQSGWLLEPSREPGERKDSWPVNLRVHASFQARAEILRIERQRINGILRRARGLDDDGAELTAH